MNKRDVALILFVVVVVALLPWMGRPLVHAQDAFASGYSYKNITTAVNTQVATTPLLLHTVTINGGTTGAVTLYDNASSCATTKLGTIQAATAPVTLTYDIQLKNGLCVTTAAATDLTVTVR